MVAARPNRSPANEAPPRYAFVGGLHCSGTALVAQMLGQAPQVSAIRDSGMPQDQGVYLQGAIPHTAQDGIPGEFADDPAQHLTEASPHNRLETAQRLRGDWEPWFGARPWRVEASHVNLLRSRLYQQLFPRSVFIFTVRHPLQSARATATLSRRAMPDLVRHWTHAHHLMLGDLPYLHAWLILRYEDLCDQPEREAARLGAFLQLDTPLTITAPGPAVPQPAPLGEIAPLLGLSQVAMALGYTDVDPKRRTDMALGARHPSPEVRAALG